MQYINYYSSPLGKITLASNGNELIGLWFEGQKYFGSTLKGEYKQKSRVSNLGAPLTLLYLNFTEMKSKQLTFAREYRGLTQKALSDAISGLSQSNLSKYEKGIGTLSDETVNRIMSFLKFPIGFLDLNIWNNVENKDYRIGDILVD